ncbi:hypothetical protein ACFX2H_033645 [Malus domestica]
MGKASGAKQEVVVFGALAARDLDEDNVVKAAETTVKAAQATVKAIEITVDETSAPLQTVREEKKTRLGLLGCPSAQDEC